MRKLRILKGFLVVLLILAVVGLTGNFVSIYQYDFSSKVFYQNESNLGEMKFWLFFTNDIGFYLGLLLLFVGVHKTIKENRFTSQSKSFFTLSGILLLSLALFQSTLYIVDNKFYDKHFMIQSLSFNFLQIILSLVIIAVSDIIKLGQITQEENELTI